MNLYEIATTFEDSELHMWWHEPITYDALVFAMQCKVGKVVGDEKRMLMLFVHEACKV